MNIRGVIYCYTFPTIASVYLAIKNNKKYKGFLWKHIGGGIR